MFGGKKENKNKKKGKGPAQSSSNADANLDMTIIPDAFYGGKDPDIYHEKTAIPQKPAPTKTAPVPAKPITPPTAAPAAQLPNVKKAQPLPPGQRPGPKPITKPVPKKSGKHTGLLIILILLLILIIGGGIWYYISASEQQNTQVATPTPPAPPPAPVVPTPPPPPPPAPEPELPPPAPTNTPALLPQPLSFPPIILADTSDVDADSLTDEEEEIFGTDTGVWDTDLDGYYDGQEVFNLYNPRGFAPIRLIDSGLIREYTNPTWGYRVYYPNTWEVAAVDVNADQVIFSAITGDYVEVHSFENNGSFSDWFAAEADGQQFTDLVEFENRFEESGMRRTDHLVAYFSTDGAVYVMVYHPTSATGTTPFRHIMQMMYQSFRPGFSFASQIPEQTILPPAPDFTNPEQTETGEEVLLENEQIEDSTEVNNTEESNSAEANL